MLELQTALNGLPGETFVGILAGNRIILVFSIFPELILLGIQTVAVDLDRRGNASVDIAFLCLLNHLSQSLICFREASANGLC